MSNLRPYDRGDSSLNRNLSAKLMLQGSSSYILFLIGDNIDVLFDFDFGELVGD